MIRLPGLHLGWQGTVAPSASRLAADPESVCAGELDAWLLTDEDAELIRELRRASVAGDTGRLAGTSGQVPGAGPPLLTAGLSPAALLRRLRSVQAVT